MKVLSLAIVIALTCSAYYVGYNVRNCSDDNHRRLLPDEALELMIDQGGYIRYVTAEYFADGGSIAMGFIGVDGEVLYVFFNYSGSEDFDYRRCFLQRSYHDRDAVEIVPDSDLEAAVIKMMNESRAPAAIAQLLPERSKAVRVLETRDVNLQLMREVVADPTLIPDFEEPHFEN